jgi:hypothetical protein
VVAGPFKGFITRLTELCVEKLVSKFFLNL